MNETVTIVGRQLDRWEYAVITHTLETEDEAELSNRELVLRDETYLVRDEEMIGASSTFFVMPGWTILNKASRLVCK